MITDVLEHASKNVWNVVLNIDRALVEKNSAILEELLSPDFIGVVPTGQSFAKTAYIIHHCTRGVGIIDLGEEDINAASIRIYDNTAVINRRVHAHFKSPTGRLVDYDVQRIEVFVKNDNQWRMVSGQGTQVIPVKQPKRRRN